MPTYLEVWEIFLDHGIQMAQIVGWKDGNAKKDSLGSCDQRLLLLSFPQLSLSSVPSAEIPWMHTFFFFFPSPFPLYNRKGSAPVLGSPWRDLHAAAF